jgi:hypothetical protein
MKATTRKAARAAYDRIPNPNAAQEAGAIVLGLPLLIVALFALSAYGII